MADRAALWSARGERTPLPLKMRDVWLVRRVDKCRVSQLAWPIHVNEVHRLRPQQDWGNHFDALLREFPSEALVVAPLHLDLWHPVLQACAQCAHGCADHRYQCSCHQ